MMHRHVDIQLSKPRHDGTSLHRPVIALTVLLSLFAARPSLAGAGMLAGSRLRVFVPWGDVRRVHYEPERRTIMLRPVGQGPIALFCDEATYAQVEAAVRRNVG